MSGMESAEEVQLAPEWPRGDHLGVTRVGIRRNVLGGSVGWILAIGVGLFGTNLFFSRYLFGDTYLDLAAGRYIANHGIPRTEVFTLEGAGRPWIDQQWLAHWLYYEAWAVGGYALLAILSSALVTLGLTGLAALMVKRGVPPQRALLWTALAYVACMGNTVIRAQSFAYPLFVFVFWTILSDSQRSRFSRRLAALLPVLVLWSNLHGTVALAIVLIATYATWRAFLSARHRFKRDAWLYTAVAACAPLTLFANPYGFSIVHYYWALAANPVVKQFVIEWQRPSLANVFSLGFFALLATAFVCVGYAYRRGYRPSIVLLALALALLLVATQGVRYQAWFALSGALLAGEALAAVQGTPPALSRLFVRFGGLALVALLLFSLVQLFRTSDARFQTLTPRGAIHATAAYLMQHPQSRILADDDSSTALLWIEPRSIGRVAFDARFEQFPQRRLRDWFEFFTLASADWSKVTSGYDVIVASRHRHPELIAQLHRLRGWRLVYGDRKGAVFARS